MCACAFILLLSLFLYSFYLSLYSSACVCVCWLSLNISVCLYVRISLCLSSYICFPFIPFPAYICMYFPLFSFTPVSLCCQLLYMSIHLNLYPCPSMSLYVLKGFLFPVSIWIQKKWFDFYDIKSRQKARFWQHIFISRFLIDVAFITSKEIV